MRSPRSSSYDVKSDGEDEDTVVKIGDGGAGAVGTPGGDASKLYQFRLVPVRAWRYHCPLTRSSPCHQFKFNKRFLILLLFSAAPMDGATKGALVDTFKRKINDSRAQKLRTAIRRMIRKFKKAPPEGTTISTACWWQLGGLTCHLQILTSARVLSTTFWKLQPIQWSQTRYGRT